jgi:8-oxo-dGTP diphosphatase
MEHLTGVYENMSQRIVALVVRCRPEDGAERTSCESTAVEWSTPDEVEKWVGEVYAVRVLDALATTTPHVRAHDGRHLLESARAKGWRHMPFHSTSSTRTRDSG